MRKIPVTANGDFNTIVGFLELNDNITDEQLMDMYVSWMWVPERKRVMLVSLVKMHSIPADEQGRYLGSPLKCSRCDQEVPYGSYHVRGTTEMDTRWICEGNERAT